MIFIPKGLHPFKTTLVDPLLQGSTSIPRYIQKPRNYGFEYTLFRRDSIGATEYRSREVHDFLHVLVQRLKLALEDVQLSLRVTRRIRFEVNVLFRAVVVLGTTAYDVGVCEASSCLVFAGIGGSLTIHGGGN